LTSHILELRIRVAAWQMAWEADEIGVWAKIVASILTTIIAGRSADLIGNGTYV